MSKDASFGRYSNENITHATDFVTPLQHGVIRYVPSPTLPAEVRSSLPAKNDREFIFVPAGYLGREERFLKLILEALGLDMPNLVIVTAATEGASEEQISNGYVVQNAESHPVAKDWSEGHRRNVLQVKVREMLQGIMETCSESGAWLIPQHPTRSCGAATMICEALPKVGSPVTLGVMGLQDNDDEDGLCENIKANMEPIGSPVKTVSSCVYDPSIKDGAPCPQLSHLLIFESPHEMQLFRDKLLSQVPDFLIAFGDLTQDAIRSVYDNVVDGSPVVLLEHTGTDVDNLCRMFRYVEREMAKRDEENESKHIDLSTPIRNKRNEKRLAPIPDIKDDLVQLFLSTWPADFDSKSVVLADPLLLTSRSFQKKVLASITASFDLKVGSKELQESRKEALDYAWSFYDIAQRHAKQKKRSAESLHIKLVTCTLLSIVASIFYDRIYGDSTAHPSRSNPTQLIAFVLTIVLPLYITSLKKESETGNPCIRWEAFAVAAAKMESEIMQFRTQVGRYRAEEKHEHAMRKPLCEFSNKTREIWFSIRQFLTDDGMKMPRDFWEHGSPLEQASLQSAMGNNPITKSLMSGFGEKNPITKRLMSGLNAANVKHHQNFPSRNGDVDLEAVCTEVTPMLSNSTDECSTDESAKSMPQTTYGIEKLAEGKPSKDQDVVSDLKQMGNSYSPMTAEEYIEVRMKQQTVVKSQELQVMVCRNARISNLIKAITVLSGATAALSLQWAVPIILAVTAALGSGQEFRKYARRIEIGNAMIVQLNELKLWWMSLSVYQKQLPHNKDRLIQRSEKIIMKEITSAHSTAQAAGEE